MRCRCADITKVQSDIDTCISAQSGIGKLSQADSTLANDARLLSGALAATVTPKNISSLTSKAGQLDTTISSKRSSMYQKLTDEISTLKDYLSQLKTEDRSYHATHPSGS